MSGLTVLFDFKDPYSYLALRPILKLGGEAGVLCHWDPFLIPAMRAPVAAEDATDRGSLHRWHRGRYHERDLQRYAAAQGLPARHFQNGGLYRQASGELAALGFNWAGGTGAGRRFLELTFAGWWDGGLDIDALEDVQMTLHRAGADPDGFDDYCLGPGLEELAAQREAAVAAGGFTTPTLLLDGEAYVGRQHIPYLRSLLEARRS